MSDRLSKVRMPALLAGLPIVLLVLVIASATLLRSVREYNSEIVSGRLSPQHGVGYFTGDKGIISFLGHVGYIGSGEEEVEDDEGCESARYTVLRSDAAQSLKPPEAPEDSPAKDLLAANRTFASQLRGLNVNNVWDLAPFLVFRDEERFITASFAHFARRTPGAFDLALRSPGEDLDRSNRAKSALLGYLWYAQSLVVPKLRRLVQGGQPFAAQRLARSTVDTLAPFNIVNAELDPVTLQRLNAVYLSEVLFERPVEVLQHRKETLNALKMIEDMLNPDESDLIPILDADALENGALAGDGPPTFSKLMALSHAVGNEEYDEIDRTAIDALEKTPREADLAALLLVRAAFWRAQQACEGEDGPTPDCPRLKASMLAEYQTRAGTMRRPSFVRDLNRYVQAGAAW